MKTNEVPQDDSFFEEGRIRDMCYAIDEDGNYKQVLSLGWDPKNEALSQAWNEIYEQAEETRNKVLEGKLSPLAWFMEIQLLDAKLLSQYSGIPKRKVKKHMKSKAFTDLDDNTLTIYAEALKMSVEELKDIEIVRKGILRNED